MGHVFAELLCLLGFGLPVHNSEVIRLQSTAYFQTSYLRYFMTLKQFLAFISQMACKISLMVLETEQEPTNTYRIHLFSIFLIFTLLSR